MNYTIKDILNITGATLINGSSDVICENFSKDTRSLNKGDVYVGIKGENYDGGTFYEEALSKGASALIINNTVDIDITKCGTTPIITTPDTIKLLQTLAKDKRTHYNIPVVAITGSVGKTSTKDIIASVLSTKYKVLKPEGSYNNEIGLPLTILKLKDHNCLVVEMGMNSFGEISLLSDIAKPTIGVITNIGTAHIGLLGSRENILKAKLEIIEGLSGPLIINNDNDLLHTYKDYPNIIRIGIENPSDYVATNIKEEPFSSTFNVGNTEYTVPVGGLPFIYNSLFAIAIADLLDVKDVVEGLKHFKLSNSRLEKIETKKDFTIIDDSFNANLDSMKMALTLLGRVKGRKIAYLGDMFELGDYEEEVHKEVGKLVKENNIDILITVGNISKIIAQSAINNGMNKDNVYTFTNIEETYPILDKILTKGDTILLKASHSMEFHKVVDYLKKD